MKLYVRMCSSRKYSHPPRKGLKIPGVGGSKAQEFLEGERGLSRWIFFFQTSLNFLPVVNKISLFAFCFSSREWKNVNLANLKHKVNIFVLVRLVILSPLESDNFPK